MRFQKNPTNRLEKPFHKTLIEVLRERASQKTAKVAFIFLAQGKKEEDTLTYGQLDRRAQEIATKLREVARCGDRALLAFPSGLDFICAFFGCLYAGVVAVPAYPPQVHSGLDRLLSIVRDSGATVGLTTTEMHRKFEPMFQEFPVIQSMQWMEIEDNNQGRGDNSAFAARWEPPRSVCANTLAFLQYTSGSTATPRGVMLTHGNLLHNTETIHQLYQVGEETRCVSWLPVYHDMGLIGNLLGVVYVGGCGIVMPPAAFVQRPVRWLEAISNYRGTISGGPNFAYELCISKITDEQKQGLDLSSWSLAYNGAEPVRAETLKRFFEAFAECGLREETLCPSYGLAEATLLVSCSKRSKPPLTVKTFDATLLEQNQIAEISGTAGKARTLVSHGYSQSEQKIVIINPENLNACAPGQIGEIWIAGPSVAGGYWNNPEQTSHTFGGRIAGSHDGPFLRSGDLGFLYEGELYVAGRLKDLIIINGRNHYPQDIELTVQKSHMTLAPGSGVAFSIEAEQEERLVVVQELQRSHVRKVDVNEVSEAIREAVARQHEVETYAIELVIPGGVPKTSSGKIQRKLCRKMFLAGELKTVKAWKAALESTVLPSAEQELRSNSPGITETEAGPKSTIRREQEMVGSRSVLRWCKDAISNEIAQVTESAREAIDPDRNFLSLGISSLKAIEIIGKLEEIFGLTLSASQLFEFPTISQFAAMLVQKYADHLSCKMMAKPAPEASPAKRERSNVNVMDLPPAVIASRRSSTENHIAIIGMACRFPGAPDLASYWKLLVEGRDAVTEVPDDHWDWHEHYDSNPEAENKTYSRWGGFLKNLDLFDAAFFNISPREAKLIDPQQRIFLETAWETFEHSGYSPESLAGQQVGVFAGASYNGYYQRIASSLRQSDHGAGVGNLNAIIPNRVSFFLNLHGPSILVDTLCSSSLVAIHLACQSMRNGECSLALAGGVNLLLSPETYVGMSRMKAYAMDGRCKAFDHRANGIVSGEGAGAVLLKPLGRALQDGDTVYAVIRGSAMNHGGQANGLLAPNPGAQAQVIREAIEAAGISADSITYVEAHGTGTSLGDPIEVDGLTKAFRHDTQRRQFCRIGSVKTNIGHLEPAAGVAGLIKVVLAMQHQQLPPVLHFEKPNPLISFEASPFIVNAELSRWNSDGPRRAGISSFGLGGTNAHVVLEEPPVRSAKRRDTERPAHVLVLSAKTETTLTTLAQRYSQFLAENQGVDLRDLCFTANTGRSHFAHRTAIIAGSTALLRTKLQSFIAGETPEGIFTGNASHKERPGVAFLFTGQGPQYAGMGQQLYQTEPVFTQAMDRCSEIMQPRLHQPLHSILFSREAESRLQKDVVFAHTALFALQSALVELWRSWGIAPDMVMGYSLGEYAAAHAAGVFTLEEGLQLVAERARLAQEHVTEKKGTMAAIFGDGKVVLEHLSACTEQISIAAFNGPHNIVISGVEHQVKSIISELEAEGMTCELLNVTHAFHSPLLNPILEPFESTAQKIAFRAPKIPFVSTLTGSCFDWDGIPGATHWRRHMREPVQLERGVATLIEQGCNVFLEIGPSAVLANMSKRCRGAEYVTGVPSLLPGREDWQTLLNAVARIYVAGVSPDWTVLYRNEQPRRISLPTYPFERRRAWLDGAGGRQEPMSPNETAQTNDNHSKAGKMPITSAMPPSPGAAAITRKEAILALIRTFLARFLEMEECEIDNHKSLLEMGSDSLVFIEAIRAIQQVFAVKITIRQLFQELTTLYILADYIDSQLAQDATFEGWPVSAGQETEEVTTPSIDLPKPDPPPGRASAATYDSNVINGAPSSSPDRSLLERVIEQQLAAMNQVMQKQLEVVRESNARAITSPTTREEDHAGQSASLPKSSGPAVHRRSGSAAARVDATLANAQPWVPYQPWNPGSLDELTPAQQDYLQKFIIRYAERTKESKRLTEEKRAHHADLRSAMSFRLCTKEIRYPIIGTRSSGSNLWDVDGNQYVDFTMGYGVNLFGHNPPFVTRALEEQLEKGIQVGPQSELAGEAAFLICKMTGMERATFCNTGTEAVMAALRVARVSTGKSKIAIFAGSYHGTSDGVLVSAQIVDGELVAAPMVPGIPPGMVQDMVVLNYGSARSLELLKADIGQFAAVLVEPVQSRKPDLQPREFLHQLRKITEEAGVALIFDETITGFRIAQDGAQGWFGIKADLATYGKVIGGGMPIGVLAGRSEYMDSIDGGTWRFGDLSVPQAKTTLYTGTFCKHPLAMAAARAILLEIERRGPALFEQLNAQTQQLARSLNDVFRKAEVPIEIVHFGSLFRLGGALQLVAPDSLDLLFYHLIHRGIYVWEGRNWFLSTAHTTEELDSLVQVMKVCVDEMQQADFLPRSVARSPQTGQEPTVTSGDGNEESDAGKPGKLPSTEMQRNLFLLSQVDQTASLACNVPMCLRLRGTFRFSAFQFALEKVAQRHEALRTVFTETGEYRKILTSTTINVTRDELSISCSPEQRAREVSEWLERESQRPFKLAEKLLWRVALLTISEQEVLFAVTAHHLIADGWSIGVLLHEIGFYYSQKVQDLSNELTKPLQFSDYDNFLNQELIKPEMKEAEDYWIAELQNIPVPCLYRNRPRSSGHRGDRVHLSLDAALVSQLKDMSSRLGASLFMVLLSCYKFHLWQLSGQNDLIVMIPVAGQAQMNDSRLIGDCSNLMPMRTQLAPEMTFNDCVQTVKSNLLKSIPHQVYPLVRLTRKIGNSFDPSQWPFFNVDRPMASMQLFGMDVELIPFPLHYVNFDFSVNVMLTENADLTFDFKSALFQKEEVQAWSRGFVELLGQVVANPQLTLASLPSHSRWITQPIVDLPLEQLAYVAPRTPVEEILASIWEQVLNLPKVSVAASFFDLGGHSLLATQIVSRVRDALGVQITLAPLFQDPTIAGLAAVVETAMQGNKYAHHYPLVAVPRNEPLLLSFSQRRLWLIYQLDTGNTAYNVIGAARLFGRVAIRTVERALTEVIKRHESLRTVFRSAEPETVQEIAPAYSFRLPRTRLSNVPEEKREAVIVSQGQEMARASFDLTKGPIIKAKLLEFGQEDHAVIITVHHIVSDGWSMGMLLREVLVLYDAFSSGNPSPLAELPIQFADYAAWQRKWLQGEVLEQQLAYWLSHLKGVPSFIELPTDRPRLTAPSFRGAHEQFSCSQKSTESLKQLCRQQGVTPFMVLLSIFSLLLNRYSGQGDFVIGTDIANRNRSETEDLIGCFVNLLPLRLNLSGDPTFCEYLQRVKKITLDAYAHQDVPFDLLIRTLRPERKLTTTPLIQVLFVLQNMPLPVWDIQGLKIELVTVPMETAEFELILSIDDTPGAFTGMLGYSTDLFNPERMKAMISHFQTLMEQVVNNPEGRLSSFSAFEDQTRKALAASAENGLSQKDLDTLFLRLGNTTEN